jgi:hypothetical protein
MKPRISLATVGKAVVASALVAGFAVVAPLTAHASLVANAYFVAPPTTIGSDHTAIPGLVGGNDCTNAAQPCATILHALVEQGFINPGGTLNPGNVINVAKGTYPPHPAIAPTTAAGNDNVTILGVTAKKNVIPINSASSSALVDLSAVSNVTISNLGIAKVAGTFATFGVRVSNAGTTQNLTNDLITAGSSTPTGVAVFNGADLVMTGTALAPSLCTSTVKGSLAGGWIGTQNMKVSAVPKCAGAPLSFPQTVEITSGPNTAAYTANLSASKKTITILKTPAGPGPAISSGGKISWGTSTSAYGTTGVSCSGAGTTCELSANTVTGGGGVQDNPIGIAVTSGAKASVSGNSVVNNTDTVDPVAAGQDGIGIAIGTGAPGGNAAAGTSVGVANFGTGTATGTGNTLTGNDNGIVAVDDPTALTVYSVQIAGNTVGSTSVGIATVAWGLNPGHSVTDQGNNANGTLLGVGIAEVGDVGQTVGGSNSTLGNHADGNGVGLALETLNPGGITNASDTIQFNEMSGNLAFGALVEGKNLFPEFQGPVAPANQGVSTLKNNTWSGNGTTTQAFGANVADFGSVAGPGAGTCAACVLGASVPAGTVPTSLTITNTGATVTIAQGEILTINGPSFGNPLAPNSAQFYVKSNTVLPANVPTSVPVSADVPVKDTPFSVIPSGTSAVNTKPGAPGGAGQAYGSGAMANSCSPFIGGSATLNTGTSTPIGGYYAC